jgi:hypothetical protein
MIKTKIVNKYSNSAHIMTHESEILENEARLAMIMIEKWGMVAALPDGEDTTGRQKMRIMTPTELVNRAFITAKLAMAYARKNGLVHIAVDPFDETLNENKEGE